MRKTTRFQKRNKNSLKKILKKTFLHIYDESEIFFSENDKKIIAESFDNAKKFGKRDNPVIITQSLKDIV